jgi:predicted neuraminidase
VLLMVANPVSAPAEAPLGDGPVVGDKHKITAPGAAVPLEKHAVWGQPRLPLTLFSSRDAGLTWTKVLDLEDESTLGPEKDLPRKRSGAEMSYPTVVVDTAGDAHISYSYYRDAIKYVRVPRGKFA